MTLIMDIFQIFIFLSTEPIKNWIQ